MADKEPKEIKNIIPGKALYCSKHGNISESSLYSSYLTENRDESGSVKEIVSKLRFFCLQCLAEFYDSKVNDGTFGKLSLVEEETPPEEEEDMLPNEQNIEDDDDDELGD